MPLSTKKIKDILIVTLPEEYTAVTITELIQLVEIRNKSKSIKYVIFDCGLLKSLDNFGGEVFLLKQNYDIEQILFCGLDINNLQIFNIFSKNILNDNIINFKSLEEAIEKLTS